MIHSRTDARSSLVHFSFYQKSLYEAQGAWACPALLLVPLPVAPLPCAVTSDLTRRAMWLRVCFLRWSLR